MIGKLVIYIKTAKCLLSAPLRRLALVKISVVTKVIYKAACNVNYFISDSDSSIGAVSRCAENIAFTKNNFTLNLLVRYDDGITLYVCFYAAKIVVDVFDTHHSHNAGVLYRYRVLAFCGYGAFLMYLPAAYEFLIRYCFTIHSLIARHTFASALIT